MGKSPFSWTALALAGLAACGGGSSPTTPTPPPTSSVASIDVTPTSGELTVAATLQLTATPRDAQGAAMSGVTVTWASSAATVASVSSGGLVTAVAAGSATITASGGGKQGQALITVTSSQYGPVVAQAAIGAAGGTVASSDIGVTIPAGALTGTSTIKLIRDTVSGTSYPGNGASAVYFVTGLPTGVTVQTRVRIKTTGTNSGAAAIGLLQPTLAQGKSIREVLGTSLFAATDSSGYLVATIPLTGRGSSLGGAPRPPAGNRDASLFDPATLNADGGLLALLNLAHATSAASHFDLWGIGGTTAELSPKLTKTAQQAEQAYTALQGMGYDFSFRATWPVQVYVQTIDDGSYGVFYLPGPWPKNPNLSYISYSKAFTDDAEYPGVVIHELFHLVKSGLLQVNSWANWNAKNWLDEATSTWVQEKHPQTGQPYNNDIALSWKDSMFTGLSSNMVANSGYGKAPMAKYIAKRWGDAKVKEILNLAKGGMAPTAAFLTGIAEDPELWWPDLLNQHLGGSLYPWSVANLIPKHRYNINIKTGVRWYDTDQLYPLGVEGEFLKRDTAMFGPNFMLPIYLHDDNRGAGTILGYLKTSASANFRPLAAGDTVKIPGHLLQRPDSILLLLTRFETTLAPLFGTLRLLRFFVDLRLPEADWYFPTITNLNSGIAFTCDKPGNTVTMDIGDNATSVWSLLAGAGTWKRPAGPVGAWETQTWSPTPAWADTLRKYSIELTSTLSTVANGDTIRANARLKFNTATAPGGSSSPPGSERGGASWWWLIVPIGTLPLAFNRRTRLMGISATGLSLLVLASCGIGQINFAMDESFEYVFTKFRFTADSAKPNDPLMQLYQGSGKTTMTSYRSEYWSYTTDPATGAKTDSTRTVCTGSGTATYQVDGTAYADGVAPPEEPDGVSTVARILGRDPAQLRGYLRKEIP